MLIHGRHQQTDPPDVEHGVGTSDGGRHLGTTLVGRRCVLFGHPQEKVSGKVGANVVLGVAGHDVKATEDCGSCVVTVPLQFGHDVIGPTLRGIGLHPRLDETEDGTGGARCCGEPQAAAGRDVEAEPDRRRATRLLISDAGDVLSAAGARPVAT